jgi:phosphoglycolate phosphatase
MPEFPVACDLLVFDLDGTLIDSEEDLANSVNATLAHLGRPQLSRARIARFIGDGAAALVRRALLATIPSDPTPADPAATEALVSEALPFFLTYYRDHKLDCTYVYPGVLESLNAIRSAMPTLPMAVLTNKPVGPSRAICDGLGLSSYFFANYGGDSFTLKKPAPQGMHVLMTEASTLTGRPVSPGRTVLVGDSHVDVETARAAGTRCLGCSYGLDPDRLRAAIPDALVDSPLDWPKALAKLLPGI